MALTDSSAETHTPDAASSRSFRRKLIGSIAVLLVVAFLALIPPLINITRLQHRIATSMSETLGRPVHLDPNVTMHVFPMPGLTLHNLVVSEDPAFGYEPTISASTVDVTLRVSSLWRRHVEFSRIHFVHNSDESAPSLNLVRNAQGRWNLESLLMNASRVEAAPTAQKKAGPAPRFPYIEATDARVNLKLGDEKMPFSLTETDFALWLPSPQQWHVRLVAKPSRTDSNVADPGSLRVEGTFEHAAQLHDVPVNLQASWHDAPLGEATRLLTGNDAGWRGTLHLDLKLQGLLSSAKLTTKLTLNGLRRADFVPAQPLDLSSNCEADADVTLTTLHNAVCSVPVSGAQPLFARVVALDLQRIPATDLSLEAEEVPLSWTFGWLKLLSPRIPNDANANGTLAVHLARSAQQAWTGTTTLTFPANATDSSKKESSLTLLTWKAQPASGDSACTSELALAPTAVHLAKESSLQLEGELSACGYTLHATGQAIAADLTAATQPLPTLQFGLTSLLPKSDEPAHLDLTCTRHWNADQTCEATQAPAKKKPRAHHR